MNVPYMHYLESRIALQEAAHNREIPFAEWLRRYNECKAAKETVRKQWFNNAIMRRMYGVEYQRHEQAVQRRVKAEQQRYVRALSRFLGATVFRGNN